MQCGLQDKRKSTVRTLSGGQMRKLQLIMMLIGDSRTCCVDEVSGGLDPLSRRRIWDILLAERGTRTFILTTHFLDEAEYLADHITVIDKGFLKAEGTISELKTRLGGGYRISMGPSTEDETKSGRRAAPQVKLPDEFVTIDATTALDKIQAFKNQGINNIQVTGPTIEEVFMKIAITSSHNPNAENDEAINSHNSAAGKIGEKHNVALNAAEDLALLAGHQIGLFYQVCNLFKKRLTILRWKWIGTLTTLLIPILGAGFMSLLIKDFRNPGCAFIDQISISDIQNLSDSLVPQIVVGPQSALTPQKIELLSRMLPNITTGLARSALIQNIKIVNSSEEFLHFTNSNYSTIVPGGFFLGSGEAPETSPTFNYRSDVGVLGIYSAVFIQNTMNVFLSNQTIATQYGEYR
jgi:ATP-binding cassette subfamily A (ABC1) protein 3